MPENEKSFIEQEEAKIELRQFFKVSAKYGFTTAVVAAAGSSLMSGNAVAQTAKEEKDRKEFSLRIHVGQKNQLGPGTFGP